MQQEGTVAVEITGVIPSSEMGSLTGRRWLLLSASLGIVYTVPLCGCVGRA